MLARRPSFSRQRLRQPAPKLSWRWENRYVLAQPLRAVRIAPSDEQLRDLQRVDEHCLPKPRLRARYVYGHSTANRVCLVPVIHNIPKLKRRDLGDAEPSVKRDQQSDGHPVAAQEAQHRRECERKIEMHWRVRHRRDEPIPARNAAACHRQWLEPRVEMLQTVYHVAAMTFARAPGRWPLCVLQMNVMRKPIIRIVFVVKVLATFPDIVQKVLNRRAVAQRRRDRIDIRRQQRAPKLRPVAVVVCVGRDTERTVSSRARRSRT